LDALWYNVTFGESAWKVKKGDLVIAKGCKSATLYVVEGHKEVGATL